MQQMTSPYSTCYSMSLALDLMIDIAEALEYMHACQPVIVHRDVTADNILLKTRKGRTRAVLADFGLCAVSLNLEPFI